MDLQNLMKNTLLTILLTILLISPVMGQEPASVPDGYVPAITADAPAQEPVSLWQKIGAGVVGLIGMALGAVALELRVFIRDEMKPLLSSWLKQHLHFRGSSVVADGLAEQITEMSADIATALMDGKLSKEEIAEIKHNAKVRIKPRLINLAGFYKKDLDAWIDEQLAVQLGKLLGLNSTGSGSKTP